MGLWDKVTNWLIEKKPKTLADLWSQHEALNTTIHLLQGQEHKPLYIHQLTQDNRTNMVQENTRRTQQGKGRFYNPAFHQITAHTMETLVDSPDSEHVRHRLETMNTTLTPLLEGDMLNQRTTCRMKALKKEFKTSFGKHWRKAFVNYKGFLSAVADNEVEALFNIPHIEQVYQEMISPHVNEKESEEKRKHLHRMQSLMGLEFITQRLGVPTYMRHYFTDEMMARFGDHTFHNANRAWSNPAQQAGMLDYLRQHGKYVPQAMDILAAPEHFPQNMPLQVLVEKTLAGERPHAEKPVFDTQKTPDQGINPER